MKRLAAILAFVIAVTAAAHGQDARPLRVCLVSGSLEYDSDKSLSKFQKYLEAKYNVNCSRAFRKSKSDLPGLGNLKSCDVMLLFTRRMNLKGEQLKQIKDYCLSGKPIVGVRTASHAIQTWLALDKEVLGGNYKGHFGNGPVTKVTFANGAAKHPILKGVEPFTSVGSLYKNTGLSKDVNVLLYGSIPDHKEPVAWTRVYKDGRIFYTSLGHQKDFDNENFRRMLVNALFWTAKRPLVNAQASEESVPLNNVPKAVLKSVKAKFPNAKLKAAGREKEAGKTVYEVTLINKGAAMDVTLTPAGKIIIVETTIPAAKLPDAVRKTIAQKYPNSKILKTEEIVAGKTLNYELRIITAKKERLEIKLNPAGKISAVEKDDEGK